MRYGQEIAGALEAEEFYFGFVNSNNSSALVSSMSTKVGLLLNQTSALLQSNAVAFDAQSRLGSTIGIILVCIVLNWLISQIKVTIADEPEAKADESAAPGPEEAASSFDAPEEDIEFHGHPLLYLMVGRVKDKAVLLNHATADQAAVQKFETDAKKLLHASNATKIAPGRRDVLKAQTFRMYYQLDKKGEFLVCLAVHDDKYPQKYAYQCMSDMVNHIKVSDKSVQQALSCKKGELNNTMAAFIEELFSKFEKPWKNTGIGKLLAKTGEVGSYVNEDAHLVQQTGKNLTKLEHDTKAMEDSAESLNKSSATATWKQKVELYKFYAKSVILVLGTIAILAIWLLT